MAAYLGAKKIILTGFECNPLEKTHGHNDYVQENIDNCNNNKSKKIDITTETENHTYGYGGVSFKKKYVNYHRNKLYL